MGFEENVLKTINKYGMLSFGDTVAVGVSGGADSTALLTVLCTLKNTFNLSLQVIHINHMLRGDEALRDCEYARALAEKNGLPFHLLECDIAKKAHDDGISEEAAGRKVRYTFFHEILTKCGGGKIAVAHNKGDSVETTLINLLRGGSLNGLKGISPVNGNIIRPLIECEREDIEAYLNKNKIPFMTDSTNAQNVYTRNIIRNVVIPELAKINPNIISTVYDNSVIIGDDENFISQVIGQYEKECITYSDDAVTLDFTAHKDLHIAAKRRLVLRACSLLKGSRRNISSENLSSVLSLNTGGRVSFNGIFVENSYGKLEFKNFQKEETKFSYNITTGDVLYIPETDKKYMLEIKHKCDIDDYEKNVIYLDADKLGTLSVRSRKDGDVFSPLGLGGSKKIKDFLIDIKMPRTERSRLPVLISDGAIAALLCIRPDEAFKITQNTNKILIIREVNDDEQGL